MEGKTNFDKVQEFNRVMGVETYDRPNANLFDNQAMIALRLGLIKEELAELEHAVNEKDQIEVLDALGDLLYVTYGAADAFGYDINKAFKWIHKSNMSKVCETEQLAQETVEWYKQEYATGRLTYSDPSYRKDPSGKYFVVFDNDTGKILKSRDYGPVDLTSLVKS